MANYNDNAASFINGLSDFWLFYFKEVETLQKFYQGTEILVGQSYLDLLSLLLNNSIQDTTIFNKEFFKLFTVNETELKYVAGATSTDDVYVYRLEDDAVTTPYLNNKVLAASAGLERNIDYFSDESARSLGFKFDILNAYKELTFGEGNSEFKVRSRLAGSSVDIRVHLDDTGAPLAISRTGYDITITYDGPANTATTTTKQIVQALNLSALTKGLILADVTGLGTGTASPPGTAGLASLTKVALSPLDAYATRRVQLTFGGKLTDTTITNWVSAGVEKGDILRLMDGSPSEHVIDVVREDALYCLESLPKASDGKINFAILREPVDSVSENEPFVNSGVVLATGADGTITSSTRRFNTLSFTFNEVHVDEIIELQGLSNVGYFRILEIVDPNTVTLGGTAFVDETPLNWNVITVLDSVVGTNGVLTNLGDGTGTFQSATGNFDAGAPGTVLRIARSGELEHYAIQSFTSPTTVVVSMPLSTIGGSALNWGWCKEIPVSNSLAFSPPSAWPREGSVLVSAKRMLDGSSVVEGTDYTVQVDTGRITPLTVWRTSVSNSVTYSFRHVVVENITPLQTGADGTVTSASPNTFSSPTAAFTIHHVGYAIKISGSGLSGATNNGVHFIKSVVSATTVELTDDKIVPSSADPNNGILQWQLLRRASVELEDIEESVAEISLWGVDVLVDKYHLYNTYGYLINKFQTSSEEYRTFIRGIFQLFMLGPTLERFESAINTVAGLSVIRDDGEILESYDDGALQSGSDGVFDFTTRTFQSATAVFTEDNLADFIFAKSGPNADKLFRIAAVNSSTEVVLSSSPVTSTAVEWELSTTGKHTVTTSRTAYVFDRDIPLRDKVTDSNNFGVYTFKAFEVLTAVFSVTDYIEDPTWFEFIQIPHELMPGQSPERRQSTPKLFENLIGPADDGRIGDPGFIIGADSEGFTPPSQFVRDDGGALDGSITGDPLFPYRNTENFFSSASATFTSADSGSVIIVDPGASEKEYRIVDIVSTTSVRIESFLPITNASGLDWEIRTKPLPKRHKAAFVVLNQFLKHHLFTVTFDTSLLNKISSDIFSDLQELIFVAKPSYTYIVVTPYTFFSEVINVDETLERTAALVLGGSGGSIITANQAPLLIIGSSWRIGGWFRYLDTTSTFSAPTASLAAPLGSPAAGYSHYVNKIKIDEVDFTSGGSPIQVADLVFTVSTSYAGGGDIAVSGSTVTLTIPTSFFADHHVSSWVDIQGSAASNDGVFKINRVISATEIEYENSVASMETGLSWRIQSTGTFQGRVYTTSTGQTRFVDLTGVHVFDSSHVGTYIRRPYSTSSVDRQVFRIQEIVNPSEVRVADLNQVDPVKEDADVVVAVDSNIVTATPGELIFSKSMAKDDRPSATRDSLQYYIVFSSGPNSGSSFRIKKYLAPNKVQLEGTAVNDTAAAIHIDVQKHYDIVSSIADWEHVKEQIIIAGTSVDLSSTPAQDVNAAVDYTAYGVREPDDPALETFDETAGDTLYSIGMPDPKQTRGRSRTGRDTDMREEPVQITRSPFP